MKAITKMTQMRDHAWEQIVTTAGEMLSGCLDLVAGCRKMRKLVLGLNASDRGIFSPILGFESETDDYPVGESRKRYSQDYLDRLDREMAEYSARAKPAILATCRRIVAELGRN